MGQSGQRSRCESKRQKMKSFLDLRENKINEAPEDDQPASPDEKSMAMDQAKFLKYVGEEITEYLNKNKEFPEWMQNKLSGLHEKAKDMHAVLAGDYEDDEDDMNEGMTASQHRMAMIDKIKKSGAVKSGSMSKNEEKVDEAAPKMKGDWLKKEREKNREHDAAMGRTATGRKKPVRQMTSTQRSLASLRGNK